MRKGKSIIVIGGSNSVKPSGWTKELANRAVWASDGYALRNLSAGANSSLMGLSRLIEGPLPQPDENPVVVWEYAINDVVNLGYEDRMTCEVLLANVERIVRECLHRGLAFVPLVLREHDALTGDLAANYYAGLARLFAHYDLVVADATERLLALVDGSAEALYSDPLHFRARRPSRTIANCVIRAVQEARPPASVPPLHLERDVSHVFLDRFEGVERRTFTNSLLSIDYHMVGEGPALADPLEVDARLLGVAGLCYLRAGPIAVMARRNTVHLMTSPRAGKINPQLRLVPVESLLGEGLPVPAGARVGVQYSGAVRSHAASNFLPSRPGQQLEAKFGLQGLLLEVPAAPPEQLEAVPQQG
ncbi:SGNH/GDSL hydrolase family protein [Jannaschia seohaensis]|uniref:Uncharacterized protein n=1 Tax=Jannaschia seohaensis TaxID=475081 RepID=A0A2Y9B0D9_9RHOB|nr:SGNH/GDSL hydrolase family protein [Jannaschia seohaensis]PWJ15101.1 hypothetical protein BCF38_111118 [Jannaschia seohaensis]SSA49950.1 hypothetical protein SAMN05421539_111118 [Jannaschia seohaensis]